MEFFQGMIVGFILGIFIAVAISFLISAGQIEGLIRENEYLADVIDHMKVKPMTFKEQQNDRTVD
jgi:hypothetical protein